MAQGLCAGGGVGGEGQVSAVVVDDVDVEVDAVGRQDGGDFFGPFNGEDRILVFEEFVPADVFEIFVSIESVSVDMDEPFFAAILRDENEGCGADFFRIEADALAQPFDEMGFTCSELARDCEDDGQGEVFSQRACERAGLVDGVGLDGKCFSHFRIQFLNF